MFIALALVFIVSLIVRSTLDFYLVRKFNVTLESRHNNWVIILMFLLWSSWFMLVENDPSKATYPLYLKIIGWIFSLSAAFLFFGTIFQLRGFKGQGTLIQNGLFRYLRHPMYFGFLLILIGYPLIHSACYSFMLAFPGLFAVLYWRYCEEKVLRKNFPEYLEYAKNTVF